MGPALMRAFVTPFLTPVQMSPSGPDPEPRRTGGERESQGGQASERGRVGVGWVPTGRGGAAGSGPGAAVRWIARADVPLQNGEAGPYNPLPTAAAGGGTFAGADPHTRTMILTI